jgi:hypothetical protein
MSKSIVPHTSRHSESDRWIERRIGHHRQFPTDDEQTQFAAEPTDEAEMQRRGYVNVAVPGGREWQRPFVIRPVDFDAPEDPLTRCPYCHRAECSR